MTENFKQSFLYRFFVSSRCRLWRHALMIFALAVITFNRALVLFQKYLDTSEGMIWLVGFCALFISLIWIYINLYILIPRLLLKKKYALYIVSLSLGILAIVGIEIVFKYLFIPSIVGMNVVLDGITQFLTNFLAVAGLSITLLLKEWMLERQNSTDLEKRQMLFEVENLKEQITPDVLFETLDKASQLIKTNAREASGLLFNLSDKLRRQLYKSNRIPIDGRANTHLADRKDDSAPTFLLDTHYRLARHLLLQMVVFVISSSIFFDESGILNLSLENCLAWLGYFLSLDAIICLNMYVLMPRLFLKNKIRQYVASLIALGFFFILSILALQSFSAEGANQVAPPVYFIVLRSLSSLIATGLVLCGSSAIVLFRHLLIEIQRSSELESATLQLELRHLKNQISPHFLFNVLNNANIMVDEDREVASGILYKLNDLLRYQLNESTKDIVALRSDILFLSDFLELEKTRRDFFDFSISAEGNIDDVHLPPLLFIPFVENAVKHNRDSESASFVDLRFVVNDKRLSFHCENSKPLRKRRNEAGGLGLKNIKRRLTLLFGNNYTLEIDEAGSRYTVNLQIQL